MDEILKRLAAGETLPSGCPRLYLNRVEHEDSLYALEYGLIYDGQRKDNWRAISANFAYLDIGTRGPAVGFGVLGLTEFDTEDPGVATIWDEPLFDAPTLGLARAPAGEIVIAAQVHFGGNVSINRICFNAAAVEPDPETALPHWYACLEAGDSMAHFAVGYCLYELGRYREAYRHLRYYLEVSPSHPWNWCWFGQAAQSIGELDEAQLAYERAIELTRNGGDETHAPELLAAMSGDAR
jgi:tetratricopeptide (TPR) repeat protein